MTGVSCSEYVLRRLLNRACRVVHGCGSTGRSRSLTAKHFLRSRRGGNPPRLALNVHRLRPEGRGRCWMRRRRNGRRGLGHWPRCRSGLADGLIRLLLLRRRNGGRRWRQRRKCLARSLHVRVGFRGTEDFIACGDACDVADCPEGDHVHHEARAVLHEPAVFLANSDVDRNGAEDVGHAEFVLDTHDLLSVAERSEDNAGVASGFVVRHSGHVRIKSDDDPVFPVRHTDDGVSADATTATEVPRVESSGDDVGRQSQAKLGTRTGQLTLEHELSLVFRGHIHLVVDDRPEGRHQHTAKSLAVEGTDPIVGGKIAAAGEVRESSSRPRGWPPGWIPRLVFGVLRTQCVAQAHECWCKRTHDFSRGRSADGLVVLIERCARLGRCGGEAGESRNQCQKAFHDGDP